MVIMKKDALRETEELNRLSLISIRSKYLEEDQGTASDNA